MDLLSKRIVEQVRQKAQARSAEQIAKGVMSKDTKQAISESTATVNRMREAMQDVIAKTISERTPDNIPSRISEPVIEGAPEKPEKGSREPYELEADTISNELGEGLMSIPTTDKESIDEAVSSVIADSVADGVQPTDGKVTHSGSFDNKEDYLKAIIPAAKEAAEKTGLDWRLIVAQSAIETGWGSKVKGNSFFGIKGHGAEDTVSFTTQEEIDGKRVTIKDAFRAYDSLEDSVAGYAQFLLDNPRYKDYLAADTLEDAAKALQASGYATDSEYGKKVLQTAKGRTLNNFLKNNPEFN